MGWTTEGGVIEWPHRLHAEATKDPSKETLLELLNEVQKIQGAIASMNIQITQLRADKQRLKHENEFMIRQLNLKEESTR